MKVKNIYMIENRNYKYNNNCTINRKMYITFLFKHFIYIHAIVNGHRYDKVVNFRKVVFHA